MIAKYLIIIVRGYQMFISPLFGARCRFYPTCSEYSIEAMQRHGAGIGVVLSVRRLLKCGPWHPGGIDPVP